MIAARKLRTIDPRAEALQALRNAQQLLRYVTTMVQMSRPAPRTRRRS